ncbi:2876_t:CDS:2, partial [Funneliformis geosporum]
YNQGNRHVYYPLKLSTSELERNYDPENLSLRTHEGYIQDVIAIEVVNKSLRKREIQKRGVNGRSILFELKSIKFPTSFPVDIMHGLFENIAPAMLQHWTGTFFKENQDNNYDYILSSKIWTEIGNIMEKNKKNMPLDFGHPPIDIQRYSALFKAEDWSNWVILYSLPLLQDYLSE